MTCLVYGFGTGPVRFCPVDTGVAMKRGLAAK